MDNIIDLIKNIKLKRMPIEYKKVADKLQISSPIVINKRKTYYKIDDYIVLELFNSGAVNKPYIKCFYNSEIWYDLNKYFNNTHELSKHLKKVTLDILDIKCSSMGRKKQKGNNLK